VDERQDLNLSWRHFVEEPITLEKDFPHIGFCELRHDSTSPTEGIERRSKIERLHQEPLSGRA